MSEFQTPFGVAEAALRLKMSEQWVRVNAANGTIPSLKIGRYRRFTDELLAEYLDRCKQGQADPMARSPRARARRRSA